MTVREMFLALGVQADNGHIEMPVVIMTWAGHVCTPQSMEWDEQRQEFVIHTDC